MNLALKPCFREGGEEYLAAFRRQTWTITATTIGFPQEDYSTLESIRATGGIVPDEHWPQNRQMVERAAEITAQARRPLSDDARRVPGERRRGAGRKVRDRLRWLADAAGGRASSCCWRPARRRPSACGRCWKS